MWVRWLLVVGCVGLVGCSSDPIEDADRDSGSGRRDTLPEPWPDTYKPLPDTAVSMVDTAVADTVTDDGASDSADGDADDAADASLVCGGSWVALGRCVHYGTDGKVDDCFTFFGATDRPSSEMCGVSSTTICGSTYEFNAGLSCQRPGAVYACRAITKGGCCAAVSYKYEFGTGTCPPGQPEKITPP